MPTLLETDVIEPFLHSVAHFGASACEKLPVTESLLPLFSEPFRRYFI